MYQTYTYNTPMKATKVEVEPQEPCEGCGFFHNEIVCPGTKPFPDRTFDTLQDATEYIRDLHTVCHAIVDFRTGGWQKRADMNDAITELAILLGAMKREIPED
jgi:hypothetical protein